MTALEEVNLQCRNYRCAVQNAIKINGMESSTKKWLIWYHVIPSTFYYFLIKVLFLAALYHDPSIALYSASMMCNMYGVQAMNCVLLEIRVTYQIRHYKLWVRASDNSCFWIDFRFAPCIAEVFFFTVSSAYFSLAHRIDRVHGLYRVSNRGASTMSMMSPRNLQCWRIFWENKLFTACIDTNSGSSSQVRRKLDGRKLNITDGHTFLIRSWIMKYILE